MNAVTPSTETRYLVREHSGAVPSTYICKGNPELDARICSYNCTNRLTLLQQRCMLRTIRRNSVRITADAGRLRFGWRSRLARCAGCSSCIAIILYPRYRHIHDDSFLENQKYALPSAPLCDVGRATTPSRSPTRGQLRFLPGSGCRLGKHLVRAFVNCVSSPSHTAV